MASALSRVSAFHENREVLKYLFSFPFLFGLENLLVLGNKYGKFKIFLFCPLSLVELPAIRELALQLEIENWAERLKLLLKFDFGFGLHKSHLNKLYLLVILQSVKWMIFSRQLNYNIISNHPSIILFGDPLVFVGSPASC